MGLQNAQPVGWVRAKLFSVVVPRKEKVKPKEHPDLPFVGMDHVESDTGRVLKTVPASQLKSAAVSFRQGDVIYGRLRPYLNKVATPDFSGLASAEFIVLPENDSIDAKYLAYRLRSKDFVSFATHLNEGDRPRVNFDQIGEFEIELPPRSEQRRIVARIEQLFSELDKGIESLQNARAQLKTYRQSLLKAAFEGRLTEQWRHENADKLEPADQLLDRIRKEREARYQQQLEEWKAKMEKWEAEGKTGKKQRKPKSSHKFKGMQDDDLMDGPHLPRFWRWIRLSAIADLVTDGTHHTPKYTPTGVPFISVKDIKQGKVNFDSCKFISSTTHQELAQRCKPEPGDLLITKSGTIGRLALVPNKEFSLFVSVALVKVQSAKAFILPSWLYRVFEYHFVHLNVDQEIKGGLLKNYHLEDLRMAKLPFCSLDEQRALINQLDSNISILENVDGIISQELKKAESLRQSILKRAFEGRLVPQDRDDEPAAELLARIGIERESQQSKRGKKGRDKKVNS